MVKSCAVFTAFGSGALERAWTREGIGDSNDSTSWQGLCWQAGGNTEWGLHCGVGHGYTCCGWLFSSCSGPLC